ncbi:bile acid:sodium symporter family protein [Cyclobacterium marinum]|uniref:Bile acid:sodium symporter n=1 Tax=Cyclobacterium marinum (strain ATCC 25205 / DSM 745 / LMG 13164 / NCIMB 1802) TaxID=880070 RepID=G0IZ02_CYCMS|nr:bile acid:sodium symporter family protein [Cyclobacterium marinum]AEL28147.1 Bile acid:sodium symporter [Cyclobacterium marinum DSM 745]|tara:strand:- start:7609 stop:8748 length:1140 start_codon:yes stop_codon:yes gene_type:complete
MNSKHKLWSTSLVLAGISLLGIILMLVLANNELAGLLVLVFFTFLLIGMQGFSRLKGFSFTVWVIAAVAISMVYPGYITEVGGYHTEGFIVPLIQLIMFGMGTTMGIKDFQGVLKMPRGVIVGLISQFTIMPILAISLALLMGFPPEIAAGIVLIGSSPSGVSSNIITFLAKGNLALSITLTAFTTILAPFLTPMLMKLLAGQFIPIDSFQMMISIIKMIFVPIVAGMVFNKIFKNKAGWVHTAMPFVAMAANVIIIAVIVAAGRDSLLEIGLLLLLAAIIHNASGYVLGYWGCRLFKMNKVDSRTIAIEVGMQNGGMAAGIASELGKAATLGLFPAIFGTWMDISGSFLANWWRTAPTGENDVSKLTETPQPLKEIEK